MALSRQEHQFLIRYKMAKVTVKYFATLVALTGRISETVALEKPTVSKLMSKLGTRYGGELASMACLEGVEGLYYMITVNGEDVRQLEGFSTALAEGDTLAIVPPVAGG
jgi:MoaD family protein